MKGKTNDTGKLLKRPLRRRELIKGGVAAGALAGSAAIFAPRIVRAAGGSITIGSFQDNAMAPFRDYYIKQFAKETGIAVNYNETNYDSWYQNCKNDGLNKTGAYDIYVMDDNWVPEFAAGRIIHSLDELGLKANPDILAKGLEMGLWPPKSGARMKDFASAKPELYALVIIDDVEILYYRKDYFPNPPQTWDDIYAVAQKTHPPDMYGWSPRGVKGNPIMMTYLPLLNSYGGNFVNDDWTPGFAGPEGVGALARLFSFIPYMPSGVAAFDTDQEVQVMLEGKCTALTE
ncbi:MAG TPA: extracellular solute-binding protein, partial [Dongiaceae bacterium]|nr:extracellular solute-binding protein [Dongiaceae bacterium]